MREIYDGVITLTDKRTGRTLTLQLEDCDVEFSQRTGEISLDGRLTNTSDDLREYPIQITNRPSHRTHYYGQDDYFRRVYMPEPQQRAFEVYQREHAQQIMRELLTQGNPFLRRKEDTVAIQVEETTSLEWENMILNGVVKSDK